MQRLVASLAGALAGLGFVRFLLGRRRRGHAQPPPDAHAPDRRAVELRRKLAESRPLVGERDEFERGETTVDRAEAPPAEPDERRRQVHDRARGAVEDMRGR